MLSKSFFVSLAAVFMLVGVVQADSAESDANLFNGDATYYHTGLGNCGKTNKDSDLIVALSTPQYAGGKRCGQRIRVTYQGKSVVATVADRCPGCSANSIDLSPSAFQRLAPLGAGRIKVNWNYA